MKRFYDIKFELEAKGKNKGELLTKYEKLLKEDAVKFFNDKSSRVRNYLKINWFKIVTVYLAHES